MSNLAAAASTGVAVGVWVVVIVLLVALFLAALASILSTPMDSGRRVVWILGCLVFQFFGPVLWFLVGRKARA